MSEQVNMQDLIDNHMAVLVDIASGKLPPSHANGTIALLDNLKERVKPKCVALGKAQAE